MSDNKLSNNNLESELVENKPFFKNQSQKIERRIQRKL